MDAPKIVPQEEVMSRLKIDIAEVTESLEETLKLLGHSEAKRLFMAATKYPIEHSEMAGESDAFKRAYGYSKNVKDALVALGVEVVIEQMLRQQQGENLDANGTSISPEILEAGAEQALADVGNVTQAAPKKRAKKEKA